MIMFIIYIPNHAPICAIDVKNVRKYVNKCGSNREGNPFVKHF